MPARGGRTSRGTAGVCRGRGTRQRETSEQPTGPAASSTSFLDLDPLFLAGSLMRRDRDELAAGKKPVHTKNMTASIWLLLWSERPGQDGRSKDTSLRGLQQPVWGTARILPSWQGVHWRTWPGSLGWSYRQVPGDFEKGRTF